MPLYEFQCQDCQAVFEVRATFKEKEQGLTPECPQCGSEETRQVPSSGLLLRVVKDSPAPGGCACGGSGCCG
jgi:putative FmdB family regulatory protein